MLKTWCVISVIYNNWIKFEKWELVVGVVACLLSLWLLWLRKINLLSISFALGTSWFAFLSMAQISVFHLFTFGTLLSQKFEFRQEDPACVPWRQMTMRSKLPLKIEQEELYSPESSSQRSSTIAWKPSKNHFVVPDSKVKMFESQWPLMVLRSKTYQMIKHQRFKVWSSQAPWTCSVEAWEKPILHFWSLELQQGFCS